VVAEIDYCAVLGNLLHVWDGQCGLAGGGYPQKASGVRINLVI
jgi:hypothetical protein